MFWEELSAWEFGTAVSNSEDVCVLPIGVLEKHGDHLPLGTDMYIVTEVAKSAVVKAPAVVFPYYFLGQIDEARHVKGTIAASHKLLMDALLEMCDEIHRNGFKKVLILNGHGGNEFFLPFFAQMYPGINRPYAVYNYFIHHLSDDQQFAITSHSSANDLGAHAGFSETSLMMHLRPNLVHMDRVRVKESTNLGRLDKIKESGVTTGFDWYASYPHHFAGSPLLATAEHGEFIFNILCDNVANVIREIKSDNMSPMLITEFNKSAL